MSSHDRQAVIGFTEAELGFFLAVLFALLFLMSAAKDRASAEEPRDTVEIPADSLRTLEDSIHSLAGAYGEAERQRRVLADSIREIHRKISSITPNCTEKGLATGPLFTVVITGPDQFRIQGETTGIGGVRARVASELRAAEAAGCIHRVEVGYAGGVTTDDYDAGRRALGGLPLRLWSMGRIGT
jgi:hypothetical protein